VEIGRGNNEQRAGLAKTQWTEKQVIEPLRYLDGGGHRAAAARQSTHHEAKTLHLGEDLGLGSHLPKAKSAIPDRDCPELPVERSQFHERAVAEGVCQ
jgi:hypothetical protein